MAFLLNNRGSHTGRRRKRVMMSEINVTPFVDVMLVLLVIFMVTAPLLTVGVSVDLPETRAGEISSEETPLSLSINVEGNVYLQEEEVNDLSVLLIRLKAVSQENKDIRIFVRGDRNVNYGRIMEVVGVINAAGYRNIALITTYSDMLEG